MMPLHARLVEHVCAGDPGVQVFDVACNLAAARALYDGSGRSAWAF